MTYNVSGGSPLSNPTKLTDNTATTVLSSDSKASTFVLSVICTEIGGNTPNLTIFKTDGVTSIYYRFEKAMAAKETFIFNEPIVLKNNWDLKVTSSDASGEVDVDVTYLAPDKTAQGFIPQNQR